MRLATLTLLLLLSISLHAEVPWKDPEPREVERFTLEALSKEAAAMEFHSELFFEKTILRGFGGTDENEDDFEEGSDSDNMGAYNDAPVGDGVWVLVVLVAVWVFINSIRFSIGRKLPSIFFCRVR